MPRLPSIVVGFILWSLFLTGLVATALLAAATRDIGALSGKGLANLLQANQFILGLLVLGVIHACWHIWRNKVRLVRRLLIVLLAQLAIAMTIAVLPLLLTNAAIEDYYGKQLAGAVEASDSIRNSAIRQAQLRLARVATEAWIKLRPVLVDREEGAGFLLDELRDQHGLSLLAVIDDNGLASPVSPPETGPQALASFDLLKLRDNTPVQNAVANEDGLLRMVLLHPVESSSALALTANKNVRALWLEQVLPAELSDDIQAIDESLLSYRQSTAVRVGVREGILLVALNAMVLLMFTSLSLAAHLGNRLGQRLERLSLTMKKVANQAEPSGDVPESGNDEITLVSRSFNTMVNRVGALVRTEKRQRATLETIQETMAAGLLVLDEGNHILTCNRAAKSMLCGAGEPAAFAQDLAQCTSLEDLAARRPSIAGFANWVLTADQTSSGETSLEGSRLHVRVATFEVQGRPRTVVMFADISKQLEEGESRAREDSFSFTLHGINNPLQAALLQAELLERRLAGDGPRAAALDGVTKIIHQLQRINDQARAWGKISGMEMTSFLPLDLNTAIHALVNNANVGTVDVTLDLAPELPQIWSEANMLQDTLENLLANALQQFTLDTPAAPRIRISTRMDAGHVRLLVEDNAGGIDAAMLPHIFKPHKSSKPGGHGIGLTRVHDWLVKAGATITATNIDSSNGRGARFLVNFRPKNADPPTPNDRKKKD